MTREEVVQAAVAGANRLSTRWAQTWDGGETVLSGLGVWPLLAALADAAGGTTRDELAEAVGLPADEGLEAARQLLAILNQSPALHTALGLWTAARVPINRQWAARLPAASHNILDANPSRARAALDAWVEKETDSLLHSMPVEITEATLLVLASALALRTEWEHRFTESPTAGSGPWADRRRLLGLQRTLPFAMAEIRVAAPDDGSGPVTLATVRGQDGVDVVLVLGEPDARAGRVLGTAIAACGSAPPSDLRIESVNLDRPQPGPGLSVIEIPSYNDEPTVSLNTVAFTVNGQHDLMTHAELFGLNSASDEDAEFPGIGEVPLYVNQAAQDAMASFSAEGFVAAAVTAFGMVTGSAMPRARAKRLIAEFDRPFGFVSVHRPTGLVLVCGWVSDPDDFPTRIG